MEHRELLELYDREVRIEARVPEVRTQALPDLVRHVPPAPRPCSISFSRLDPARADARIAEQIEDFAGMGRAFEWLVCEHDHPPDLRARLLRYGFTEPDESERVMVLDLARAPERRSPPGLGRLESRERLGDVARVLEAVWGRAFDWIPERLGTHLEVPDYLRVYATYVDDRPVAAAWMYLLPGRVFAYLYGGSVLAEFRGRGLYRALLDARAEEAERLGYRYLAVDAGAMSGPILERYGFALLTRAWELSYAPREGKAAEQGGARPAGAAAQGPATPG